jgi:4-hydroxyphenylpyruvate dioxygenase-like putative hemolysin
MGAKGFGAGNFKALLESIERTAIEERYKKNIILHIVKK